MQNNLYWTSTLVFSLVLFTIYLSDAVHKHEMNKIEKSFSLLLFWVILFCVQDCFWGLCNCGIIRSSLLFFISSEIFHISTVITTFFWLSFILTYMGNRIKHKKLFLTFGLLVILFEFVLVITNIFVPVLFSIKDGQYVTEILRPFTFFNQYIVYFLSGIITFIYSMKEHSKDREKFISVFFFNLAPILLGICQLLFPDCPFYSMGYFLGCFIVHIFVVTKLKEENIQNKIITSIADIYYSIHIFDLQKNTNERILESSIVKNMIGNITDSQTMIDTVIKGSTCEDYLSLALNFANLKTLPERMKEKSNVSIEFIGKNYGWTRLTFIAIERNDDQVNKVLLTTQIIDEEKREEIKLLFQSNHDELTELYNRHAYEETIKEFETSKLDSNLVYISMDLNELKIVNDTLGHSAGDEIIIGAASCMKKCFGIYGSIYRTGGDEFAAIIKIDEQNLEQLKSDFNDEILNWKGKLVDHLSVSCGYVLRKNLSENATIHDMASFADKIMYAAKNDFYKSKGIDRRGQKDAHVVLCSLYTKILKINPVHDTFQIINIDVNEKNDEKDFNNQFSVWLEDFVKNGNIHPDDLESFKEKTDLSYMIKYFQCGKKLLSFIYRRKYGDEFKQVTMDIVPANDYTPMTQNLFLYVKSID